MLRSKSILLALASAGLTVASSHAQQVTFGVGSIKSFRQFKAARGVNSQFRGGTLDVNFLDGNLLYGPCTNDFYLPPGFTTGICAAGTSGYVSFGNVPGFEDPTTFIGPYYEVISLAPAVAVEPSRPEMAFLRAAPQSTLQRPLRNFVDRSLGVYYNLNTPDVREYRITSYESTRLYRPGQRQRGKFESDLPVGVYHYSFPRLNAPNLPVNISSTLFPFIDGPSVRNNQKRGLTFNTEGYRFNRRGFLELNFFVPNTIKWTGLRPSEVVVGSDKLNLSLLYTTSRANPRSPVTFVDPVTGENPVAIYPTYLNEEEESTTPPNILLKNPLVSEFILPPVLASGDTGVIQLEVERFLKTGGITYDNSRRIFELPVTVVNKYLDYAKLRFGKDTNRIRLLDDYDRDGFNNLTEWILDSFADDPQSVPVEPIPATRPAQTIGGLTFPPYYGFAVIKKLGTSPAVKYQIQRSTDNGRKWMTMFSDVDWEVYEDDLQIRLSSRSGEEPEGTSNDRYRIKITRN